ncbi:hypothetical protein PAPHI01_1697 [Pancytospora philotis]|nr:hypothetical protein PAPHI01_1697 [Pancytospora philotis]
MGILFTYLLAYALCSSEYAGYLYSIGSGSIVQRTADPLGTAGTNLAFVIRVGIKTVRLFAADGDSKTEVFGGPRPRGRARRFKIRANKKNHIQLRYGRKCLVMHDGRLTAGPCGKSRNGLFVWIPRALFEEAGPEEQPGAERPAKPEEHRNRGPGISRSASRDSNESEAAAPVDGEPEARSDSGEQESEYASSEEETGHPRYAQPVLLAKPHIAHEPGTSAKMTGRYVYRVPHGKIKALKRKSASSKARDCVRHPINKKCLYVLDEDLKIRPLERPRRRGGLKKLCNSRNEFDRYLCDVYSNDQLPILVNFLSPLGASAA